MIEAINSLNTFQSITAGCVGSVALFGGFFQQNNLRTSLCHLPLDASFDMDGSVHFCKFSDFFFFPWSMSNTFLNG
jgi:hypothetical protein